MYNTLLVMRPIKLAIIFGVIVLASCHRPAPDAEGQRKTLSLQFIDSAVIPGNDFARYANGKWLDTATIPPTEYGAGARWEMSDSTKAHVHLILESAAGAGAAGGTITQQVGDLYLAGMDTLAIDQRGVGPVEPFLKAIDSIRDTKDILLFAASQVRVGFPLLISQRIAPDEKNSSRNIAIYDQFGLGLPDRDYYVKKDSATRALIDAYKLYLTTLFTLSGEKAAAAAQKVEQVFALESQIAAFHKTNVELMDPQKNYHKMAVSDAQKAMPLIGWETLLTALGVSSDSINIEQPEYYQGLNTLLRSTPLDIWKSYLRVHTLDNAATYLSHDLERASFAYYDQA
jgi:putative endopeptidase